jgi:hypothetical protein
MKDRARKPKKQINYNDIQYYKHMLNHCANLTTHQLIVWSNPLNLPDAGKYKIISHICG